MRNHLRSNIVGYVALFFALSLGTAYAVDKNSIKSKHIGAGQVKTADLGNAAVTGDKLATGSVGSDKLAANSVDGGKVIDDSLKGADVDESSLDLPAPPTVPSSLPPSGAAGGDLSGAYPNPQLGPNSVGAQEVDGSLTGADIANAPSGSDDVNADTLDGLTQEEYVRESSFVSATDPSRVQPAGFFSYDLVTTSTNTYELRGAELRTIGVSGQFMVCSNGAGGAPYVIYVNGIRTVQTLDANGACTDTFNPGVDGDFMLTGPGILVFGYSTLASSGNYDILGFEGS